MLKVIRNIDVDDFLRINSNFLYKSESLNNLILGLVNGIRDKDRDCPNAHFHTVFKNNEVIGSLIQTHYDKPLVVSEIPEIAHDHVKNYILNELDTVSEIVGESVTSELLAEKLSASNKLIIHLGIYQTSKIDVPDSNEYFFREASRVDQEVVSDFLVGFISDCFPQRDAEKGAIEMLERLLDNGNIYLLFDKDNKAVSMAAKARETKNAATVSLVYTPSKFRKNGYGSLVTALVTEKLLKEGKQECNLFTDLMNPTSNSIYQKIGYRKIGENKHFKL